MQEASVEGSLVVVDYRVGESDLNGYSLMHGGRLLTLADETGYLCACRHGRRDCLTVAVHRAGFHRPARQGDTIRFEARLGLTGHSSMWVAVEAFDAADALLMDAVFVYAAVDGERRPVNIPSVQADSANGRELQQRMRQLRSSLQGDGH